MFLSEKLQHCFTPCDFVWGVPLFYHYVVLRNQAKRIYGWKGVLSGFMKRSVEVFVRLPDAFRNNFACFFVLLIEKGLLLYWVDRKTEKCGDANRQTRELQGCITGKNRCECCRAEQQYQHKKNTVDQPVKLSMNFAYTLKVARFKLYSVARSGFICFHIILSSLHSAAAEAQASVAVLLVRGAAVRRSLSLCFQIVSWWLRLVVRRCVRNFILALEKGAATLFVVAKSDHGNRRAGCCSAPRVSSSGVLLSGAGAAGDVSHSAVGAFSSHEWSQACIKRNLS